MTGRYFFSVILLICVATAAAQDCPYTLVTKTGIQEANATDGARVQLIFNSEGTLQFSINNMSEHSVLGTDVESFQNDTLDVFFFDGPCQLFCDLVLVLDGSTDNSWNIEFFILRASLNDTGCDYTITYPANTTLEGPYEGYPFNFCTAQPIGTEKQKLSTRASLLRLVGMPSYTT